MVKELSFSVPLEKLLRWYSTYSGVSNPQVSGQEPARILFYKWLAETGVAIKETSVLVFGGYDGVMSIKITGVGPEFDKIAYHIERLISAEEPNHNSN
jgi:hypothetical protein